MNMFYLLFLFIPCIIAKCEQYTTQETCLNNCWCFWRSGAWQKPDACFPISAADVECIYENGILCTDNESGMCYVGDAIVLLFKVGLFVIGTVGAILLAIAVVVLICFVIGKLFAALQEELTRRGLQHWIRYVMTAISVFFVALIVCVVVKKTYVILMVILDMIGMFYESRF